MYSIFQNQLSLFSIAVIATIVVVRISLFLAPRLNVYIGKYNVHHLYTGAVLLVLDTVLLIAGAINAYTVVLAGVAVALILDELGYLVTTSGADKAYFARKSYTQMCISVATTLVFTLGVSTLVR
jgi:hypothetical protein